eukprot:gene11574-21033_t
MTILLAMSMMALFAALQLSRYTCTTQTSISGTADVRLSNGRTEDTGYSSSKCESECTSKSGCTVNFGAKLVPQVVEDGSQGLTIATYTAGNASAASCIPQNAFLNYVGDVKLTGDACRSLTRIERSAFNSMRGTLIITCALDKLTHIAGGAFIGAGNAASTVILVNAFMLEWIGNRAFAWFKGAITISGRFPALKGIDSEAFHAMSNPASTIGIACSFAGEPLTIHSTAFDGYKGSRDASGEQAPCTTPTMTTSSSSKTAAAPAAAAAAAPAPKKKGGLFDSDDDEDDADIFGEDPKKRAKPEPEPEPEPPK